MWKRNILLQNSITNVLDRTTCCSLGWQVSVRHPATSSRCRSWCCRCQWRETITTRHEEQSRGVCTHHHYWNGWVQRWNTDSHYINVFMYVEYNNCFEICVSVNDLSFIYLQKKGNTNKEKGKSVSMVTCFKVNFFST